MSLSDQDILDVQRLRKRVYREKAGLTIVEGWPEVQRAHQGSATFEKIFICPELFSSDEDWLKEFPTQVITKDEFSKIAFGDRLKGILALCRGKAWKIEDIPFSMNHFVLVIESVEKPGNLGTMIRSADGSGVDCVVITEPKTDIYNQHVVRSSVGTVFHKPVLAMSNQEVLDFAKEQSIRIFGATAQGSLDYSKVNLNQPVMLVVGNEHSGLSSFWKDHCDELIKIPMSGSATSLNVGMSATVLLYEAARQRNH